MDPVLRGRKCAAGQLACTVIVGDEPVGSPVVDRLDVLVALTTPSLEKHGRLLGAGSLLVVHSALVSVGPRPRVEIVDIPCTQLARAAGSDKLVSIVALGAVLARRAVVSQPAVLEALSTIVGAKHPELLAANLTALESGMAAARERIPDRTLRVGREPVSSTRCRGTVEPGGPSDGRRRSNRARPRW